MKTAVVTAVAGALVTGTSIAALFIATDWNDGKGVGYVAAE